MWMLRHTMSVRGEEDACDRYVLFAVRDLHIKRGNGGDDHERDTMELCQSGGLICSDLTSRISRSPLSWWKQSLRDSPCWQYHRS